MIRLVVSAVVLVSVLLLVAWRSPSTVRVSRTLAAPPERVWALWEQEQLMARWWGPKGYSAPVVRSDLRVGGSFLLVMLSPSGADSWNVGKYLEVEPGRRIVQSLSFADAEGHVIPGRAVPLPGRWPSEVIVTTELRTVPAGTEVSIVEQGIPLVMKPFAGLGWIQQFDKMERILEKT